MPGEPWLSEESRMTSVALQVLSRALRQPGRVLAIALLATAALVAARALRQPSHEATLYFRLAEGVLTDPRSAPRPPRAFREYVTGVVLSRQRVEQIMRTYHWSEALLARNPVAAVDDFRSQVQVEVGGNYFLYERRPGDPPRSAQVTISVAGPDAEQTRAVVHEIGQAVLADQNAQRRLHLAQTRQLLETQIDLARERTRSLQAAIDRLWARAAGADALGATAMRVQIAMLEVESNAAIERLVALERRAGVVAFTAAAEDERLGLSFELFDESLLTFAPRLTPLQLASRAALVFAVALVLAAAAIGAFDDRIYGPEDLAVRDLPFFGAVPGFPGDDVGSYFARISRERGSS